MAVLGEIETVIPPRAQDGQQVDEDHVLGASEGPKPIRERGVGQRPVVPLEAERLEVGPGRGRHLLRPGREDQHGSGVCPARERDDATEVTLYVLPRRVVLPRQQSRVGEEPRLHERHDPEVGLRRGVGVEPYGPLEDGPKHVQLAGRHGRDGVLDSLAPPVAVGEHQQDVLGRARGRGRRGPCRGVRAKAPGPCAAGIGAQDPEPAPHERVERREHGARDACPRGRRLQHRPASIHEDIGGELHSEFALYPAILDVVCHDRHDHHVGLIGQPGVLQVAQVVPRIRPGNAEVHHLVQPAAASVEQGLQAPRPRFVLLDAVSLCEGIAERDHPQHAWRLG